METNENMISEKTQEKLYTKDEVESIKSSLEAEIKEQEAKKSSMTELEKVKAELEVMKKKYQEKEDECLIAKQKQETLSLLEAEGISSQILGVVYTPKDMESTKLKIQILKDYIEEIKTQVIQNENSGLGLDLPLTSTTNRKIDPFLEGFLSV